ncbi:hypothetical protein CIP100294_00002 [Corynebacterium diphtheriae]|nr:hypothetical protein CIP100294_00002 [Corynebacterium diphtheriae]
MLVGVGGRATPAHPRKRRHFTPNPAKRPVWKRFGVKFGEKSFEIPPFGGFPVLECIDCVSDVGEDVLAALAHGFLDCPHVGYSLMGSTGSASMTMAFPLGCTVGPWLWMDGLDTLIPTKPRTPISCATPEPQRTNQCTLKPEEPIKLRKSSTHFPSTAQQLKTTRNNYP